MKKFWIQVILLIVVILSTLYISFGNRSLNSILNFGGGGGSGGVGGNEHKQLKVGNSTLNIEVADTSVKRAQGLSGRDSLATDGGMLFVFPVAKKYQFWMKNMKISLDMIFINKGKVVDLLKDVPPPIEGTKDSELTIYAPVTEIDMVLEVNSGYISSHNIQVGDSVAIVK